MFTFARTTAKAVVLAAGTAGFLALGTGIASAAVLDGAAETRPQLSPEELTNLPGDVVGPYSPALANLSDQVGGEVSETAGVRDVLGLLPAESAPLARPVQDRHAQRSAQPDRDIPTVDSLIDELAGIDTTFTPLTDTNRHAQRSAQPDRDIPTVDSLIDELAGIDTTFAPVNTDRRAQRDRGYIERQVVGSPVTELPEDTPDLLQAAADDLPVRVSTLLEGTGVPNTQPPVEEQVVDLLADTTRMADLSVERQSQTSPLPLQVSTPPAGPGSADLTVWPGTITETEAARNAEQAVGDLLPGL